MSYEIEIELKRKASAERFLKHLKQEHPKYSKNAEIESEKTERKHRCKNTIWTGKW